MKIVLKENYVAVLKTEFGEVIGTFYSTELASFAMEKAVSEYFDCACSLTNPQDFDHPLEEERSYTFVLYGETPESDVFEEFKLVSAPLFNY
jgi:hypothetical protein